MRSDVFYWVLNLSLHGGLVCLLLWLLRLVRPIPRRVIYPLWLGAGLRLTVPFAPSVPWSLMHLLQALGARPVPLPNQPGALAPHVPTGWPEAMNSVQAAADYFPITYKTDALHRLFSICAVIWIAGAALCLGAMAVCYVLWRRSLRRAEPLEEGVWVSSLVTTPGLVGVLRPRILVPPGTQGALLTYVVRHEQVHRRRLDNLWRLVALAVCCVHWFNPVVWLSLRLFFADMELSCDEAVAHRLTPDQRRDYARALLSVAEGRDLFAAAFGGAGLRTRMEQVLTYRRLTTGASIVFALMTGAVLSALALG